MNRRKSEKKPSAELPLPSSSDLRGRQSVRATFKLTENAIEALSVCAIHLGIKQKSLFDHLIDDIETLHAIAERVNSASFSKLNRVQKTYVLSRKTLSNLEEASRRAQAPRDALVEYSIQRLMPVIRKEAERHRRRKRVLEQMARFLEEGEAILNRATQELGAEDPVTVRLEGAVAASRNAYAHALEFVEKGDVIEEFVE